MNKPIPIPIFETIHEWDNVIRLTDKDDYQWECKNVGGFERALTDGHVWRPGALKFLNDHTLKDYQVDFDLIADINKFFGEEENHGKFEEYFKCINE